MPRATGRDAEILRPKGGIKGPTRVQSVSLDRDVLLGLTPREVKS